MHLKALLGVLVFGLLAAVSSVSMAAPIKCSDTSDGSATTNPDGLSTSQVMFRSTAADDCYGIVQSPSGGSNASLAAINAIWGPGFSFWLSDTSTLGGGSGSAFGLQFDLAADNVSGGSAPRSWTLTISDPGPTSLPKTFDIAVVLKAAQPWAAWLFNAEEFLTSGSSAGTFRISWTNNGGNYPALSGMHLAFREVPNRVPEPSTLALLGIGLVGIAFLQRRKK